MDRSRRTRSHAHRPQPYPLPLPLPVNAPNAAQPRNFVFAVRLPSGSTAPISRVLPVQHPNLEAVMDQYLLMEALRRNMEEYQPRRNPVGKKQLNELTTKPITKTDQTCTICFEELKCGDRALFLPCEHSFHPNCIMGWLKEQNTCPICRTKLRSQDEEEGESRTPHRRRARLYIRPPAPSSSVLAPSSASSELAQAAQSPIDSLRAGFQSPRSFSLPLQPQVPNQVIDLTQEDDDDSEPSVSAAAINESLAGTNADHKNENEDDEDEDDEDDLDYDSLEDNSDAFYSDIDSEFSDGSVDTAQVIDLTKDASVNL